MATDLTPPTLRRAPRAFGVFAGVLATALCGALAGEASAATAPLPRSSYGVRAACAEPAPGSAGCLALQLVPLTAQARARTHPLGITRSTAGRALSAAAGGYGLRPQDLHTAYQLPTTAVSQQTIALVDAYNDPTAEADLKAYDEEFSLPACTTANGCFSQVNQRGETGSPPFPASVPILEAAREAPPGSETAEEAEEATGWGLEISLDIEAAHATCQSCRILLVEANSPRFEDLEAAEASASRLGAQEVSNSWGGPERGLKESTVIASAFNRPGTVITASAGDTGYLSWGAANPEARGYAEFPASSPSVVAVGGTRLRLGTGASWAAETVWNGNGAGGGGCSVVFKAPPWQQNVAGWSAVGCAGKRAVADVAADADPYSGIAVHDTSPECETHWEEGAVKHVDHWCTVGGTSLASPLVAAVYALAGGAGGVSYPARSLYRNSAGAPGSLHDITVGSNGACATPFEEPSMLSSCTASAEAQSCTSHAVCLAGSGYDGPTGVGTPQGIAAFAPATGAEPEPVGEGEEGAEGRETTHHTSTPPAGSYVPPAAVPPAPIGPPRILSLGLTLRAVIALNRRHPRVSLVSFTFTISSGASVRVSLAKHVRRHRRVLWSTMRPGLTLNALSGRNGARLSGRGVLSAGTYRLTLSPLHGVARSTLFQIG